MPGLKAFVTSFLFCEGRVLLLRRRHDAAFAPGFWTGVGGKVHEGELGDLTVAALREVHEEACIRSEQIRDFHLEVILTQPEGGNVVVLAFYSGQTDMVEVGPCDEGELLWVDPTHLDTLPMIENARRALQKVLRSQSDTGVWFGLCKPQTPDHLQDFILSSERWYL